MSKPGLSPRRAALEALLRVEEAGGYSNLVLGEMLPSKGLSPRDRALAAALFYGVLEKKLTLDYYLAQCLRDPKRQPEPAAMAALRCGAYQILYMDRVPDSAAVNETVQAVKAMGRQSCAGFVNGVLRGLLRKRGSLSLPEGDSLRALALRWSIPEGLVRLWLDAYGQEVTKKLLPAFGERAGLFVRINTQRVDPAAFSQVMESLGGACRVLPAPFGAALLEGVGDPTGLAAFQEGLFHVQDLSAQWVCALLAPQPGDTVCDCCAAPGGKSFTLAQLVGDRGRVYAFDLHESRVGLIKEGAARLGLADISAQAHDAREGFKSLQADRVLCDVPCSGFGVIRRKPEIRYKPLKSLEGLPALQLSILKGAAQAVKPGGRLVYATCTLNPAENAGVAGAFLKERPDFVPVPIRLQGLSRAIEEPAHQLTMFPFTGASDGFFAAVFQKA